MNPTIRPASEPDRPTDTTRTPAHVLGVTDQDLYLFNEGTHCRMHHKLGAHLAEHDGVPGAVFAVWAPNAARVSVIGDFNHWDNAQDTLQQVARSGIWQGFISGVEQGQRYKFHIVSRNDDYRVDKADPYGFFCEEPPLRASVVWDLGYRWSDRDWMEKRGRFNATDAPMSIYEVHLGSWRRPGDDPGRFLTYRELAPQLAEYVRQTGFTHVELLPVMEHPLYASWGYQVTGFFAPTSRYGTPQDLMYLIDVLHQNDIGVILDWVPAHFPSDEHGLTYFDGTHLYEHADPEQRIHPDWGSYIFNYGRHEVRSFLLSSAMFWLEKYHADGLRVDAVASMLYLDYSRKQGEWRPNVHGGRENLDALHLVRAFNEAVHRDHPDVQMIAEESTAWPMVSRPTWVGGLGFGFKWDMGWMHDTLTYLGHDPIHRSYHHDRLTFRSIYAFSENFVLPLSHDEVVHGKGSLIGRMPGDDWQKFANLRLLLAYMWSQPGKKLLFMGGEFGHWGEWDHDRALDWSLLDHPRHAGLRHMVGDLNRLLREEPALHERDCDPQGFEWIDGSDVTHSVVAYLRKARADDRMLLVAVNFTPVPRPNYQLGVPVAGHWHERFNSDAKEYGGSGQGNFGGTGTNPVSMHGHAQSLTITLPPLGLVMLGSPR